MFKITRKAYKMPESGILCIMLNSGISYLEVFALTVISACSLKYFMLVGSNNLTMFGLLYGITFTLIGVTHIKWKYSGGYILLILSLYNIVSILFKWLIPTAVEHKVLYLMLSVVCCIMPIGTIILLNALWKLLVIERNKKVKGIEIEVSERVETYAALIARHLYYYTINGSTYVYESYVDNKQSDRKVWVDEKDVTRVFEEVSNDYIKTHILNKISLGLNMMAAATAMALTCVLVFSN